MAQIDHRGPSRFKAFHGPLGMEERKWHLVWASFDQTRGKNKEKRLEVFPGS